MEFLPTKLYMPEPATTLVKRPMLTQRFDEALANKQSLILVAAPAGFGKSTLVSQWLQSQNDRPSGWLSLDRGDQNITRFLGYMVYTLNSIAPGVGAKLIPTLRRAEYPPVESIFALLITDLVNYAEEILLVLDDYHEAECEEINQALLYLLDNLPQNLTLIITSRAYPDLPLSRLRVRGQLHEIDAEDLRFSDDDARYLLNQNMHLSLNGNQIRTLRQRTEGWVAGLQLAALSMERMADKSTFVDKFDGSHRYITDYLTEEVLGQQSTAIQEFLLVTSLTDRMCADLCNTLLDINNSQEILEYLEAHNLFVISLDHQRVWYRYHHLFAELLQQRLQQKDHASYIQILQKISGWYRDQGNSEEAVSFAFASEDMNFAAQMLAPLAGELSLTGRSRKVRECLEQLPEDILTQYASLCLYYAITNILQRDFKHIEALLDAAEQAEHGVPPGYVDMARALYDSVINDGQNVLTIAEQALAKLPDSADFERSIVWLVISTHALTKNNLHEALAAGEKALAIRADTPDTRGLVAIYHNLTSAEFFLSGPNKAEQWVKQLDQQRQDYEQDTGLPMTGTEYLLGMKALIAYERNELQLAEQFCLDALDALKLTGEPYNPAIRDVYLLLIQISLAKQDPDMAQRWYDEIQKLVKSTYIGPFSHQLLARGQVAIWIAIQDHANLQHWFEEHSITASIEITPQNEEDLLLYVRWLIINGSVKNSLSLIEKLQDQAASGRRNRAQLCATALHALALYKLKQEKLALNQLSKAVELAAAGNYVRTLLDIDPGIIGLLRIMVQIPNAPTYADKLLEETQSTTSTALDTLSAREIEVLQLMAKGMTNNAIATQLVIAPGTVKRHTANIYEKLYVNNRTEAVFRAQEQGLLS